MARQKVEIGSELEFIRPKALNEQGVTGLILKGTYLGPVPNTFDEGKNDYKFETVEGKTVIINGAGSLSAAMAKVEPGSLCEVEYNGKKEITSGKFKGKSAHAFEVFLDM